MERFLYQHLLAWKESANRKPLVLYGARQVGKTWLLQEFGRREYQNVAIINCDNQPEIQNGFYDFNVERLIRLFSAVSEEPIIPGKTLIILDEIQEAPLALTSLKYFQEQANQYHIAAAGSLLGVTLHKGTGFPVGKTDEMTLYPFSFEEFLAAAGKKTLLAQLKERRWIELNDLLPSFIEQLRLYYFVGGMPGVLREFFSSQDLQQTRKIQLQILNDYDRDFGKHIPLSLLPKVRMVWNAIPMQLAKENKKFIYSAVRKGARAKDFEDAIQWLQDAGLLYKITHLNKLAAPCKFYEDMDYFKLFAVDLGLLGAMAGVTPKQILSDHSIFEEYKGSFTEQYVAQQLIGSGLHPYYYSNEASTVEIDFVIQKDVVYPIEVKAEENLKSKSLRSVITKNATLKGWRFSMSPYRDQDWMANIPLPFISEWARAAE